MVRNLFARLLTNHNNNTFKLSGENCLFETNNDYHKSSCAELYLQCGMQDDQSNVFVDLVTQILSEPCYNQLRTKEQLGYIVFCGSRKSNGVQGIRVIVQSAKHPAYVEERIEHFLNGMIVSFFYSSLNTTLKSILTYSRNNWKT